MTLTPKHTKLAGYVGYLTQALTINYLPLLFITFTDIYDISFTKLSLLIAISFSTQLLTDLFELKFSSKLNLRASVVIAHILAVIGMTGYAYIPSLTPTPFLGLIICVVISAIGAGLVEVLISPIVEACPTDKKSAAMSILHSFYCWGQVGVTLLSTLFFKTVGIEHWKLLACLWAIIPAIGAIAFSIVPIYTLEGDMEGARSHDNSKNQWGLFAVFFILMVCAGAAEMAMSQWASSFAEASLGIDKTTGDLLGPCFFALLMGSARLIHARLSSKIALKPTLMISAALCIVSYLTAALAPIPIIALIGCALCGLSVGIMWPGTYSLAAKNITHINMSAFALLAIGGDLGCTVGPAAVGWIAAFFGNNLKISFLIASVFPIAILTLLLVYGKKIKNRKKDV